MGYRRIKGSDRITEDHPVRTAAKAVDSIREGRITRIEVRARAGGKMASCGESHDANAPGIDAILRRARTHGPDGTLGITQFDRMTISMRSEPVEEDVGRDAKVVEEHRRLGAFVIRCQSAITAAGANDDRSPVRTFLCRTVNLQTRLV